MDNVNKDYYFLRGGGEMGKLIRAKDWSKTSLGDPSCWPQSLCTMVAVMMENPFGMYIAWGHDYTQLYNDGYRPILGTTKHPQALGISTRETFSEIWHIIESMFDDVMKGKGVGFPDFMLPLNRNGFLEECYFDFSYSPIRKDDGEVGGVLVTVIETTYKKRAALLLKESNERFLNTMKQAPVAITILRGADYTVEMANDAYLKLVNKKEAEFVGKPLFDTLPEVEQTVRPLLDNVVHTDTAYHGNEIPVPLNRYGKEEIFYFDFIYYPLKEDNKISGVIVVVTEATEKVMAAEKIKKNQKLLHAIFFNAPAAIGVITGPEHTYVLANNAYQQMVNRTEAQLVGKKSKSIFPELTGTGTFEIFDGIYQTGQPFSLAEYPVKFDKNNDGNAELRYFGFSAVPIKDADEKFDSIVIVAIDITEQVQARKTVEESENRFQLLVRDATAAIVVLTGPDMKVEIANEAYGRLIDLKPIDLLGKPLFSVVPDAEAYYLPLLEKVRQTGEMLQLFDSPYAVQVNGKHIEGYLHIVFQPYHDNDENIIGVMAIMQDVTDAVLTRKKIEQSEKKFEAAILAVEGIIWTNNANGEMMGVQAGWANLTGQPFEAYQGYGWANAVHPDDAQPTIEAWKKAVTERTTFEVTHRVITKDGEWRFFSVKAVPAFDENGAIQQWVGVHTDITEQRQAEEKLAYRTTLLEAHNEASVDGILLVDAKGKMLSFNQRFVEIWNMPAHIVEANDDEAAVAFAMTQLVNPRQFIDKVKYLYEHPTETSLDELEFKDGKIVERNGYPVVGKNGTYYAWSWTFRDVTKQKKYEKAITESEERFRTLAQTLPQLVWVTDALGNAEFASDRWKEYSGIEPGGEKEWKAIVHPDDYDNINAAWMHSLSTGIVYRHDVRLKSKEGEYKWHTGIGEPIVDKENKIVKWVGAFTDIQDRKVREEKKDEFISIASHELKTPLTTAKAYLQMLELSLDENKEDANLFAKKANQSVNKLNQLISELLDVSKIRLGRLNYTITTFNFNDMIDSTIENVQLTTSSHTIVKTGTVYDKLTGDKNRLQQVVINLLTNAIKYSPGSQNVYIAIEQENNMIQVSVKDSGIGIALQNQTRIFEKYHRVEEHAVQFQGLGIGLFISYEIIQRHQGKLWVESEIGKGSTFYFTLPIISSLTQEIINNAG